MVLLLGVKGQLHRWIFTCIFFTCIFMLSSLSPNNKDDFLSNSRYQFFFFFFFFFFEKKKKKIQILAIN